MGLKSAFRGKNFVFDERLGERVDEEVISHCHQCGRPADSHTNCANDACHLLFIQCDQCRDEYHGCCSGECKEILTLPVEEQKELRISMQQKFGQSKIFKSRLRPELKERFHAEAGMLMRTHGK